MSCSSFRHLFANWEFVGKCVCVVLLILQGSIIDYYLVKYNDHKWSAFVLTDIFVVTVWIFCLVRAHVHFTRKQKRGLKSSRDTADELPYGYICWLVYISCFILEISVILKVFADRLNELKVFGMYGQNMLKLALCMTPLLYLILVNSLHDSRPLSKRKLYLEKLTGGVTIDMMDSIEILEILFESRDMIYKIPTSLENAVLAFAFINFLLPTFALFELKWNKFSGEVSPVSFRLIYSLGYVFLVNVPLLCIRLVLWMKYDQDVSVFICKNIIVSVISMMEVYGYIHHRPKYCATCKRYFDPLAFEQHQVECQNENSKQDIEMITTM